MNKRNRFIVTTSITSTFILGVCASAAPALADTEASVISEVTPEVLVESIPASEARTNIDGTREFSAEDVSVKLPKSTSEDVVISSTKGEVGISLPQGNSATDAKISSDNLVEYENGDGTDTTVVPKLDGSLQILSTIEDASSPTSFTYDIEVPSGYGMFKAEDGSVDIKAGPEEGYLGSFAPPWAVDSAGTKIPTSYEVSGSRLIQVVDHTSISDVVYPIVAVPWFGADLYYSPYVTYTNQGFKVNVSPTGHAIVNKEFAKWWAHRDEVRTKLTNKGLGHRWIETVQEQFYCHIAGLPASQPEFNMESWRPIMNWAQQAPYFCNYPQGGFYS